MIDRKLQQRYEGYLNTPFLNLEHFGNITAFTLPTAKSNSRVRLNNVDIKKVRLGKLVERFVTYELKQHSEIQILIENYQVQQQKQTLGEIDCILLKNNIPIHLEIVYKFYLYDTTVGNSEIDHWIGPNRKDSLTQKLEKLCVKQLPILHHPATKSILAKHQLIGENISQQVFFKAQLFVPLSMFKNQFNTIKNQVISGFYITKNELLLFKGAKFYIPEKLDWLLLPHSQVYWMNFEQFNSKIVSYLIQNTAPLCWMKRRNGQLHKFFLIAGR